MNWCSYDAEGDAGSKGLIGVSIVSDRISGYFTDTKDILNNLLLHAKEGYTFVSHNAEYDISVVFWQLKQDVQCKYYNNKFNRGIWLFDKNEKPAQIWDSLGLSGLISLERLGKSIGLPKLYTPRQLGGTDEERLGWICDKHKRIECIECYAVRDAEIVYTFMLSYQQFLSEYDIKPKRTIGSAAVAIWRSLYKPEKINLPIPSFSKGHISVGKTYLQSCNCDACTITNMSRMGYFGGRVDVFKVGTIPNLNTADVTSMYPYIMKNMPMPDPKTLILNKNGGTEDIIHKYEGITECIINIPYMHVPPLPVSNNGKLIFGYGTVRGTWCNCEIRKALSLGCQIESIIRQVYSINNLYPFELYVSVLMELREQYKSLKDAREQTVKILLNSLYGRIGIREDQVEKTLFPIPKGKTHLDYPKDTILRTPLGPQIEVEKTHHRQNPYSNVMWAAHITAYARLHLLSYLLLQGDSLVYCDTDSVFSDSTIHGTGKGLGGLLYNGHYDMGHIVAPKLYSLESTDGDNIYRAKGVPSRHAKEFLLTGDITFTAPYKPREAARRGEVAGVWHDVPRHRRLELSKRIAVDEKLYKEQNSYSDTIPINLSLE